MFTVYFDHMFIYWVLWVYTAWKSSLPAFKVYPTVSHHNSLSLLRPNPLYLSLLFLKILFWGLWLPAFLS